MRCENALLSPRNIYYNLLNPSTGTVSFPSTTSPSGGIRADASLFKSGYTTIAVGGCTPYIAYHQAQSSTGTIHSQIAYDALALSTDCAFSGGFTQLNLLFRFVPSMPAWWVS
jgi:hypothetical protein